MAVRSAGKRKIARRKSAGTAMIELAFAGMVMAMMAAFAIDIGVALLAYGHVDRSARDAARAAAQGANLTEARNLAFLALRTSSVVSPLLDDPIITAMAYRDFHGNPPDGVSPTVTVVVRSKVRVPAPIFIFGNNIGADAYTIQRAYTFPIVRLSSEPAVGS